MPVNSSTTPPTHSFAGLPVCNRLDELAADIAIIGIHYISPYPQLLTATATQTAAETASGAIRLRSSVFSDHRDHFDFDRNEVFLADGRMRVVDCGDVSNAEGITTAIRTILNRGAVPIALGTDEGGFIPFIRAREVHRQGINARMDRIPATGSQLIISSIGTLARSRFSGG
jgi:agmatinase